MGACIRPMITDFFRTLNIIPTVPFFALLLHRLVHLSVSCRRFVDNSTSTFTFPQNFESHGIYRTPSPYREPLFVCVCIIGERKRAFYLFSNCICINIKHSVTLHRRNITRGEKDGLGRNKTIGDLLISLFIQSVSFIGVLGLPRKRENRSPRVNSL